MFYNTDIISLLQLGKSERSSHNTQNHSKTVVVTLQSKLANMSSSFKSVLETRTEVSINFNFIIEF